MEVEVSEQLGRCEIHSGLHRRMLSDCGWIEETACKNWQPVPAPAEPVAGETKTCECTTERNEVHGLYRMLCMNCGLPTAPAVAAPAEGKRRGQAMDLSSGQDVMRASTPPTADPATTAEIDIMHAVEICEQNGARWMQIQVSVMRRLLESGGGRSGRS